ncbi:SLATT domain-containing protein [Nocardia sp. NPDC060259]|uniref:SLATT domain-containing protein n=1 Tax=Nocardia sp. NPDC060259 TaxID=3347088 RepID=UPI00365153DB
MSDLCTELGKEADILLDNLEYTEKSHFAASERSLRMHWWLGIIAVVAGAAAAIVVLKQSWPAVAAGLAGLASATSAVLTLVNPKELAQRHLDCGRDLGALRVEVRQVRNLDLPSVAAGDLTSIRKSLRKFAERKATIDRAAPGLNERAFKRARRKIQRGDFQTELPTS